MATLYQIIAEKFFAKLAEDGTIDAEKMDQLRLLIQGSKKPKADDFVKIFAPSPGGDVM